MIGRHAGSHQFPQHLVGAAADPGELHVPPPFAKRRFVDKITRPTEDVHAFGDDFLTEPGGGDFDRCRRAQFQSPCSAMPCSVPQQIDTRLQVRHTQPQRLVFEQRLTELTSTHHAGQGDSDRPLTRRCDLPGDRHPLMSQSPTDGCQPVPARATSASAGTQVSMQTAAVSSGPAPTLR